MTATGELLPQAASKLKRAGVNSPRLDAELLLADCLGCRRQDLYVDRERLLSDGDRACFARHLARRLAREPVARILGHKEFWSLAFTLNEATLVPRPESETIVETALVLVGAQGSSLRKISVLDLGTGCGCLVLALLQEMPAARGLGTDASHKAIEAARHNAQNLGLTERARFETADWHEATNWRPLEAPFDLIISNPPYVDKQQMQNLQAEVRDHDPPLALDGGPGGLSHYPAIIEVARDNLADKGWLVLEVGIGQAAALIKLMRVRGFRNLAAANDLAGLQRVVYGKKL